MRFFFLWSKRYYYTYFSDVSSILNGWIGDKNGDIKPFSAWKATLEMEDDKTAWLLLCVGHPVPPAQHTPHPESRLCFKTLKLYKAQNSETVQSQLLFTCTVRQPLVVSIWALRTNTFVDFSSFVLPTNELNEYTSLKPCHLNLKTEKKKRNLYQALANHSKKHNLLTRTSMKYKQP